MSGSATVKGLIAVVALFAAINAQADDNLVVGEHFISECVSARIDDRRTQNNMTIVRLAIEKEKPLGECGCKSKMVYYQVDGIEKVDPPEGHDDLPEEVDRTVAKGEFGLLGNHELDIVTNFDTADGPLYDERRIRLGCPSPM